MKNNNKIKEDTTIMWYLFFVLIVVAIIIFPFLIKVEVKLNLLRLKFVISITIMGKFKRVYKVRVKHGYLYIYYKNKERKEKISRKNTDLVFLFNFIKQSYFRQELKTIDLSSQFGYRLSAVVTATGAGYIDVLSKCIFSKIKNNKKSSHISILVNPKYNEDICSLKLVVTVRNAVFDVIYALLYAKYYTWREYESNRKGLKQREKNRVAH